MESESNNKLQLSKFFFNCLKEFETACQDGTQKKYLDENPEFVQMIYHQLDICKNLGEESD